MNKLLLLVLWWLTAGIASAASVNIPADTTTRIPNPGRGFYFAVGPGESCNGVAQGYRDGGTLSQPVTLVHYDQNPTGSTATFTADMACLRALGLKVILSFSYCTAVACDEARTISQVQADINTWAPFVAAEKNIIAFIRASFIGAWGYWISDAAAPTSAKLDAYANKVLVRDAIMSKWPAEIPIQFNQPALTNLWYGNITANNSFKGDPKSRAGFYNHCAMATADDVGAYPGNYTYNGASVTATTTQERNHVANNSTWTGNGWQTCQQSGAERLACTGGVDNSVPALAGGIMNEGPRYHLSYIHRNYYQPFMTAWISGNCYNTVDAFLGYRIQFDNISHSDTAAPNTTLTVAVKLRNTGWGPVLRERRLNGRLVLAGQPDIPCTSPNDLRKLPPQGTASKTFQLKCSIPGNVVAGNRTVQISMPDQDAAIKAVRRYKIKPANTASGSPVTWDDTAGELYATSVTLSGTPPPPPGGGGSVIGTWQGMTTAMWAEVNSQRATFGDTNNCKARIDAIPTTGTSVSPGGNIQAALNANTTVILQAGTYNITTPITVPSNKFLIGAPGQIITINASGSTRGIYLNGFATVANIIVDGAVDFGTLAFSSAGYTSDNTIYNVSTRRTGYFATTSGSDGMLVSSGSARNCIVSSDVSNSWNGGGGSNANGGNADGIAQKYSAVNNTYIDVVSFKNGDDGIDVWGGSDATDGGQLYCYFCNFHDQGKVDGKTNNGNGNGVKLGPSNKLSKYYKSRSDNNKACGWNLNPGSSGNQVNPTMVQSYGSGNPGGNYCNGMPTPP